MGSREKNIFDWASEQLEINNMQNVYKGCFENQRQDYNIKCLEILTEGLKNFPHSTFTEILLNFGLLDANIHEESNNTLGRLRERKGNLKLFYNISKLWSNGGIGRHVRLKI